jgi:DNA-binding NarL/FixJ family response regulator
MRPPKIHLTKRQEQVASRIAVGKPIKEVAFELKLSQKTVEYHWAKVRDMLGIQDYVELTHFAIATGMVKLLFKPKDNLLELL